MIEYIDGLITGKSIVIDNPFIPVNVFSGNRIEVTHTIVLYV